MRCDVGRSDVACNPYRCWCPSSHLTCGACSAVAYESPVRARVRARVRVRVRIRVRVRVRVTVT
eukprot:scaffold24507_cov39-Phaeocystis_antarctica.AAC.2